MRIVHGGWRLQRQGRWFDSLKMVKPYNVGYYLYWHQWLHEEPLIYMEPFHSTKGVERDF